MSNINVSVFIATSLDGYIARPNGDIDWLDQFSGDMSAYEEFSKTVDCIIMGRSTMEKVLSFGIWPYEKFSKTIILSHSLTQAPQELTNKVEIYSGCLKKLIQDLETKGFKHIYVDGGKTIQSFLSDKLITGLTISRVPIILGQGLPLFGKTNQDILLEHVKTRCHENGIVESKYSVKSF